MLDVKLIRVIFRESGATFEKTDVLIGEGPLTLSIYESDGKYSVIPMSSLSHYDVELS